MSAPGLEAAYACCRAIHRRYGRTFYLATRLLPRDRRPHVHALYAFARVADEMVDSPAAQRDSGATFLVWSATATETLRASSPPDAADEPVLAATWHTLRTFDLDPRLIEEFLRSMAMDLSVARYATWDDLRDYMRGSAAVIGEMMAPVLGAHTDAARLHAGLLGEAFQLTNFVRDVAEDHERGRIYLPQADLTRHGVTDLDIAEAARTTVPSDGVRRLIAFEIARARSLYELASPGVAEVDWWARPCLRVATRLYAGILDEVEALDLNVFADRAVVPRSRRLRAVATAWRHLPHENDPAEPRPHS
ncbi:phytoene/squalene synthase family protein [Luteipulveratus mongoliensis]|uniref:Uncharacterized protein n=1 Tax=Luteipulveratus mongoliensis TaxID=571913 RepID=A0A0K1JR47_9MICO|nr:phytoene/squalene synthase family protein [Luteipulveratus mongoliensis]AKU19025.1 hypothetical protein VV02_16835 [Luteipulveratus mongoliensis]